MEYISLERFKETFLDHKYQEVVSLVHTHMTGLGVNMTSTIRNDEIFVLAMLVHEASPDIIVETGTNEGVSTLTMALYSEAHIYTFDVPHMRTNPDRMVDYNTWGRAFANSIVNLRIHKKDQSTFDLDVTSLPRANVWFIDSGHSMKYVKHETELARKNMPEHGMIIWHDAKPNLPWGSDVDAYLREFYPNAKVVDTSTGIAYYKY